MSKIAEPYKCDACSKSRDTDANHWWLVWLTMAGEESLLSMSRWNVKRVDNTGVRHACGEDCASKLIQRWMQTGTFEAPSQRPISKAVESV